MDVEFGLVAMFHVRQLPTHSERGLSLLSRYIHLVGVSVAETRVSTHQSRNLNSTVDASISLTHICASQARVRPAVASPVSCQIIWLFNPCVTAVIAGIEQHPFENSAAEVNAIKHQ
jgi:hypothetical protein